MSSKKVSWPRKSAVVWGEKCHAGTKCREFANPTDSFALDFITNYCLTVNLPIFKYKICIFTIDDNGDLAGRLSRVLHHRAHPVDKQWNKLYSSETKAINVIGFTLSSYVCPNRGRQFWKDIAKNVRIKAKFNSGGKSIMMIRCLTDTNYKSQGFKDKTLAYNFLIGFQIAGLITEDRLQLFCMSF